MDSIIQKFKTLDAPFKIYALATTLLFVGFIVAKIAPTWKFIHNGLVFSAPVIFAAGFAVWCWPKLKRVWALPAGKVIISISNLFVLVLTTMLARSFVAESLGLPPQDFDLTVHFFVLLLFIPSWALIVSIPVGVFAFVSFIGSLYFARFHKLVESLKLLAHTLGALAFCMYLGSIFDLFSKNGEALYPLAKWIAWAGDFQPSTLYPGIKKDERIRLLENGVISSATIENGEVVIRIRTIPSDPCQNIKNQSQK